MESTQRNWTHILTNFILYAAVVNIIASIAVAIIRNVAKNDPYVLFDLQALASAMKVVMIAYFFIKCCKAVKRMEEPPLHMKQLLFVWGVILIAVQIIYDITTVLYGNVLDEMMVVMKVKESDEAAAWFAAFYNGTHGFKYIGMFIAILLGIIVTGIIMRHIGMVIISGIIALAFMIAFCTLHMWTLRFSFAGLNLGIVWTSVIFHSLQTVGLLFLGIYLRNKYPEI